MQTYFCQNIVFLTILSQSFPQNYVLDNKISMITVSAVILKELKIFILTVIYHKYFKTNFTGLQDNFSYKNKHFLSCGYPDFWISGEYPK